MNLKVVAAAVAATIALGATASMYFAKLGAEAAQRVAVADRDSIARWGDITCALTGTVYRAKDTKRSDWGKACQGRIQYLAKFEADTVNGTNQVLNDRLKRQSDKAAADLAAAVKAASRTERAAARMEKANAGIQEDRVGGEYFAALNELGGLRGPQ